MEKRITTPLTEEKVRELKAGDSVMITGYIFTARDAAHKRMVELIEEGKELPIDLRDQIIYYVGPTPPKEGTPIGSAGPTTSSRMDSYTPAVLEGGLRGMIGKGYRSQEVVDAMIKYGAVYFAAIGGAAALAGKTVRSSELVAYEDLGSEAIRRLYVEDFPAVVVIDAEGNDFYRIGQQRYLETLSEEK